MATLKEMVRERIEKEEGISDIPELNELVKKFFYGGYDSSLYCLITDFLFQDSKNNHYDYSKVLELRKKRDDIMKQYRFYVQEELSNYVSDLGYDSYTYRLEELIFNLFMYNHFGLFSNAKELVEENSYN